jgi:hypothetical protein
MTVIQAPGVSLVFNSLHLKIGLCHFHSPSSTSRNKVVHPWAFHVDDRSESSSTYDMIIGIQPRPSWRIRYNHELKDNTVTWDTDNIPMKDRDTALYHQ